MPAEPPIPAELAVEHEPEWSEELDEAVFAGTPFPDSEEIRAWRIEDDGLAEWAMRKLAVLYERHAVVVARAQEWRDRIERWEKGELARVDGASEFFEQHLEDYALRVREADPKRATIKLPSGDVPTRFPKKPAVHVVDEDKVLAWARDAEPALYEAVVKVTEKVKVMELRKAVGIKKLAPDEHGEPRFAAVDPNTGEVIPGTHTALGIPTATAKPIGVRRPKEIEASDEEA